MSIVRLGDKKIGINVPSHVDNEAAYIEAAEARIKANAAKGARKRGEIWIKEVLDRQELINYIRKRAYGGNSFYASMLEKFETYGKLTPRQEEIVRNDVAKLNVKRAERLSAQSVSEYVGKIGERLTIECTVSRLSIWIERDPDTREEISTTYTLEFTTADQSILFYRGGVHPWIGTKDNVVANGDRLVLAGGVKRHFEKDGVKKTVLERIRVKEKLGE